MVCVDINLDQTLVRASTSQAAHSVAHREWRPIDTWCDRWRCICLYGQLIKRNEGFSQKKREMKGLKIVRYMSHGGKAIQTQREILSLTRWWVLASINSYTIVLKHELALSLYLLCTLCFLRHILTNYWVDVKIDEK